MASDFKSAFEEEESLIDKFIKELSKSVESADEDESEEDRSARLVLERVHDDVEWLARNDLALSDALLYVSALVIKIHDLTDRLINIQNAMLRMR